MSGQFVRTPQRKPHSLLVMGPRDLAPGLEAVARGLQGRCAIEVHVAGTPVALSEDVEEDLLPLGQEAITNAVRLRVDSAPGSGTRVVVELDQ